MTAVTVGLLCLGTVALALWWTGALFGKPPFTGPTFTVRKEKLKVTIVARGTLESAKNGDIVCTVRSGTKGSTISTTIRWVVDAGAEVKGPEINKKDQPFFGAAVVGLGASPLGSSAFPGLDPHSLVFLIRAKLEGQQVMELDSSGFQEQLKDKEKEVRSNYSLKIQADELYKIQLIQNEVDKKAAKNLYDLSVIDEEKYIKGDFEQAKKDVEGRIETSQSDYEDWKYRAAWSLRMFKKGLMSKVQADADASREKGSQIALGKVMEEQRVLYDYTRQRTLKDLAAKKAENELNMRKVELQANSKLAQAEADMQTKDLTYQQEKARYQEIEREIAKCIVRAPQDGLVVYYVPEQVRGGGGTQQSIVAQGEPVREGQKMLQIPDLNNMEVNVRVPEAFVTFLKNPVKGDRGSWQRAKIKVDAFSNRILNGHVRLVDTVASIQDWFASDVKVYKTMIKIDEHVEGLKPGMSAEVTITADESSAPVLVVPVQSVVGTISTGADRKCFVVGANGQVEERAIVVGMSNERLVEVKSGLHEGEVVVQNPQPFIKEGSEDRPGKERGKGGGDGGPGTGGDKKPPQKKTGTTPPGKAAPDASKKVGIPGGTSWLPRLPGVESPAVAAALPVRGRWRLDA